MKHKDFSLSTLIVHGVCPYCKEITPLVSIETNIYKCVTCGDEVEQYVNGVIKYLPTTRKGRKQLYGTKG
jgi:ribosomal protein L37AE/L43A